jgi:hypothetical protein
MTDRRPPKRRGRPPLDATDKSVPVTVSMPSREYDRYDRQARQNGISIPEVLRRLLHRRFFFENR